MTVTAVDKDPETRTLRITAEFDAPVERVWQLWSNPRLLERWWGPPTYPATFDDHDLVPGADVTYRMTGPGGDQARGWWKVLVVDAPHRLELEDGFGDADGAPDPGMPTMRMTVGITAVDGHTRMTITTTFATSEDMDRVLSLGMEEGMSLAIGQIDDILAELAPTA